MLWAQIVLLILWIVTTLCAAVPTDSDTMPTGVNVLLSVLFGGLLLAAGAFNRIF